jgi:glycosyltransferase involved in cell wall biosynthesis
VSEASGSVCDVTIVAHDIGPVGGMERVLAELITGLSKLGHKVTVIARRCELARGTRVDFHRVPGPARPVLIAYPWFMLVGSLMLRRRRRGLVQATGAIVLNDVDVIAVHYCHQVGPVNPSRSSPLFRAHAKVVGLLLGIGERICFARNRDATFVCVSDGVAQEMREHYPQLAAALTTIHNGVDTETFAPPAALTGASGRRGAAAGDDDRLVAAFVGGEWERKGLRPLIEALGAASEWSLVVAGHGDQAHYEVLADALGVGGRVRWLGVTADVQGVYRQADAFVLPSSYETFSLGTFEAAASGLPILATAVSGVRELVRDGENGFIITAEPHVIAQRLRELAADASLRARLGRAARESALQFSWEKMVSSHHELYARRCARA